MTHQERLDGLDRYDLHNLIEAANKRLKEIQDQEKTEYYVVSDDCLNLGFFRKDNLPGALKFLAEHGSKMGVLERNKDSLTIEVQRWYPDEVEDLVVPKDNLKEKE